MGSLKWGVPEQTGVRQGWIKSHTAEIRIRFFSLSISVWASSSGKISPDGSKGGTGPLRPTPSSAGSAADRLSQATVPSLDGVAHASIPEPTTWLGDGRE